MISGIYNMTIEQGSTFKLSLCWKNSANQPIPMIAKKIILSKYSGYSKICLFSYNSIRNNNFDLASLKYEYLNNKFLIED